jgi:hypothetical protein
VLLTYSSILWSRGYGSRLHCSWMDCSRIMQGARQAVGRIPSGRQETVAVPNQQVVLQQAICCIILQQGMCSQLPVLPVV